MAIDALFQQIMRETLQRWLSLAEERLRGKGVRLYVMLGNDDEPALRDVLVKMKDKLEFGLRVNWAREEVLAEIERESC